MTKLGFIGCGNMARAIIQGILSNNAAQPADILTSNSQESSAAAVRQHLGVEATTSNTRVAQEADIVFLCTKPQTYSKVIEEIAPIISFDKVVVTLAPGKTIPWLEEQFGKKVKLVRTMPNTPALVGQGITGYCPNSLISNEELAAVESLLDCVGKRVLLPEHLIDAESALGGSAPAFVYAFIEALSDGGVAEGLPRAQATEIAAQTVLGAATMVLESGKHPGQLKDEVCSPGGSTIRGMEALEKDGFRGTVMGAVRTTAAAARNL